MRFDGVAGVPAPNVDKTSTFNVLYRSVSRVLIFLLLRSLFYKYKIYWSLLKLDGDL